MDFGGFGSNVILILGSLYLDIGPRGSPSELVAAEVEAARGPVESVRSSLVTITIIIIIIIMYYSYYHHHYSDFYHCVLLVLVLIMILLLLLLLVHY